MSITKGGRCVMVSTERTDENGTKWVQHARHRSTSPDIDASRSVAVHICDHCHALFVASDPMGESQLDGAEVTP